MLNFKKSADKSSNPEPAPEPDPLSTLPTAEEEFQSLLGLLSVYSAHALRMNDLQGIINLAMHAAANSVRDEFATIQRQMAMVEEKVTAIAEAHPEWFAKRKSIVTPCGMLRESNSTSLDVADEQLAVAMLRKMIPATAEFYLRVSTELNREALEQLTDEQLAAVHIRRVARREYRIEPLKVNMGKLVAPAAASKEKGAGK